MKDNKKNKNKEGGPPTRIVRMEDLGLVDDGIITTVSSSKEAGGEDASFYSAKEEQARNPRSVASHHTAYYSTTSNNDSDDPTTIVGDQSAAATTTTTTTTTTSSNQKKQKKKIHGRESNLSRVAAHQEHQYDDTESGMWSFQGVGLDNDSSSNPSDDDESLFPPVTTQEQESDSIVYSIANYSEDPNDRYSLADVEEAAIVARRANSENPPRPTRAQKARTMLLPMRKSKSTRTQQEPPIPQFIESEGPVISQAGSADAESRYSQPQQGRNDVRPSNKAQRRCTAIIFVSIFALFLVVIGVALVLYFVYLRDGTVPTTPAGAAATTPGSGAAFPAPTPPGDDYITITSSPTAPAPSSSSAITTKPTEMAPDPTNQPVSVPTRAPTVSLPTRSPITAAEAAALANYLTSEHSVVFADDDLSTPNNEALAWLLKEAQELNTSVMVFNEKMAQRFAMAALTFHWFKEETTDGSNNNITSFAEPLVDECDWSGVACINGTVTELAWGSEHLVGSIPPEIGMLHGLTYLDLSQNELEGSIPEDLYRLTDLEELYLYGNQIAGTLSDSIGDLTSLERLHLSHNQLSGTLPLTMKSPIEFIRPYIYINLKSNNFSGTLPTGLRWRRLWYLDLGDNDFEGPIPEDINTLAAIRHLYLDHNRFNGTIPDVLPDMGNSRIQTLALDHNQLEGAFPDQWDMTWHMLSLTVHNNSLTQSLPSDVCNMNVFQGGEMVELNADCSVCSCASPFCQQC